MRNGQMVLVACSIEAGAFSGERVIRLKLADSGREFTGIVPVHYCRQSETTKLGANQPAPGSPPIEGFVEAYLVNNSGEQATVELPSGDVVRVNVQEVPYELRQSRDDRYVPVGS
jgi:hypothetical protein